MKLKRRNSLLLLGERASAIALGSVLAQIKKFSIPFTNPTAKTNSSVSQLSFQLVKGLIPLKTASIAPQEQIEKYRNSEDKNEPATQTCCWQISAMSGKPATGGVGFSNLDNLLNDCSGNLWVVTDIASSNLGLFGNNSLADAGKAYLFCLEPMECETISMGSKWYATKPSIKDSQIYYYHY